MSVPSSLEELLQLIRKSGMLDEQKLAGYMQRRQLGRGPLPNDPREAAEALIADGMLTNFQAEQFLLGKWRGFTIGKYKLLERVGVGGMGQVFLCEHMFMKRRVAVKVLPPAKAEQPAALGRFYREARAAGSLDHPNIVRTHDIDQDGNLHFIVMEYVDGCNLLDMVKKFGPMDIRRACSYIKQVALGLEFAFKNGIIHRDVKPGNILIDRRGVARVLDMGLARFYKDTTDLLTVKYDDKIVLGTADYVAPEQVANSHSVDVRADIYGLGATFYFLLAGHPPFPTGTVSQKLLWHRTKEPTAIRQLRPELPEELAEIVTRMLSKDPSRRCQTPSEVVQLLTPWVTGNVPLPTAAEMPQMCPAVMEALESGTEVQERLEEEPVGAGVGTAESKPIQNREKMNGGGGQKPSYEPAPALNPFGPPPSNLKPAFGSPAKTPVPNPHPFRNANAPAASPQPMPVPQYSAENNEVTPFPRKSSATQLNRVAMQVQREKDNATSYKMLMYLILFISFLVGGGLLTVKLWKNRVPAETPANVAPENPGNNP